MINFLFKKRFNSSVASCYADFIQAGGLILMTFVFVIGDTSMFYYLFLGSYVAFSLFSAYIQKKYNYTHLRQQALTLGLSFGIVLILDYIYMVFI